MIHFDKHEVIKRQQLNLLPEANTPFAGWLSVASVGVCQNFKVLGDWHDELIWGADKQADSTIKAE